MLAKQEADQRSEEAMMSGKPVQLEETTELNRVREHSITYLHLQVPILKVCTMKPPAVQNNIVHLPVYIDTHLFGGHRHSKQCCFLHSTQRTHQHQQTRLGLVYIVILCLR